MSTNTMSLALVIMGLLVVAAIPGSAAAAYGDKDWSSLLSQSSVPEPYYVENKVYRLYPFRVNWYRAMQFCHFHNMRLASIESQEQQDALRNLVKQSGINIGHLNKSIWLSGTDLVAEGEFVWMETGKPMTYTNWLARQPDNTGGKEHCVHFWATGWNDWVCSSLAYFVCEEQVHTQIPLGAL